jgi:hypothetical protein
MLLENEYIIFVDILSIKQLPDSWKTTGGGPGGQP